MRCRMGEMGQRPDWAPDAIWDFERSYWMVRLGDLSRHGVLEIGECVVIRDSHGLTICRGSGLDTPAAHGLYFVRRDGLTLHRDGSWSETMLAPGVARPRSMRSMPPREAFTGIWDSLDALLCQVLADRHYFGREWPGSPPASSGTRWRK